MPLKSVPELMGTDHPADVVFVAHEDDYALTLDRLAALIRQRPDVLSHSVLYFERERVPIGDGHVLVRAEAFHPLAQAA